MAGIEIAVAERGANLKDFIALPWDLYADYPRWVPPLRKEVRRMLDLKLYGQRAETKPISRWKP